MGKKLQINKGDRFGRLEIIDEIPEYRDSDGVRKRLMVCKCDCGTIKNIRLNDLRLKNVISCGCKKRELSVVVGERYGNLVVEKFVDRTNPKYPRMGLRCDCGNYVERDLVSNFKNRKDKSCGCVKLSTIKDYGFRGLPFNFGDKRHMLKYVRDVEPDIHYVNKDGKDFIKKTKLIEVECDCGKVVVQNYARVRAGRVKCCGCSSRRFISEAQKGKENHRKLHFTKEQVDRMVELHNQKISLKEIGKEFGVTANPIKIQLELRGCEVKQRRYEITEGYFKTVDSEEKAYWLGFLAADGCIRRRVNDKDGKTRGDGISLKLSVMDEKHMERFRDSICPDARIYYYRNKTVTRLGNDSYSDTCNLRINGNELVQDIIKLGVGPRKTFTVGKPNIAEEYYRHFIRGFFDGDGCCYVKKKLGNRGLYTLDVRFSFACASKDMRDFFAEELIKIGISTKSYDNLNLNITGGFLNSKKFFDYIYTDATIYLQRKYDKGMIFVEHFNNLPKDVFINEYVYNPDITKPDEVWTEEELKILIETNDKIPYSYLSGGYIPNKSKQQIFRMRKKLGLKARRKVPGYLNMRKEIKGY